MAQLGVMVMEIRDPENAREFLVMDGIRTKDRPAAVGYFVLTTLREWYQKYNKIGKVSLYVGHMEAADIPKSVVVPLRDDWSGLIYRLVIAVERNDKRLLSDNPAESGEF